MLDYSLDGEDTTTSPFPQVEIPVVEGDTDQMMRTDLLISSTRNGTIRCEIPSLSVGKHLDRRFRICILNALG